MNNLVESIERPEIINSEDILNKDKILDEKLNFSQEYLKLINSIEQQKDLLINFFSENDRNNDSRSENDSKIDLENFDENELIKEDRLEFSKLCDVKYRELDHLLNNKVNIEEALRNLENIKNKVEAFEKSAADVLSQIMANEERLNSEKVELEKKLKEIQSQFIGIRLFKINEIKDLEKNILNLESEIVEQEKKHKNISSKVSNISNHGFSYNRKDVTENLIKEYLRNINIEFGELKNSFLNEKVIEKFDKDYVDERVVPYLFDNDGNAEYLSDMDEVSQEDKEVYLEVYKKYLSLRRGAHADAYDLTPEEKKEHEERINIFNKVEKKLSETYFHPLKYDTNRFKLYQSQTNSSFNDEFKVLAENIFSELCYVEGEKQLQEIKDKNEKISNIDHLSTDSRLNSRLDNFNNLKILYPRLKQLLTDSSLFREEDIDEMEYSLIQKLNKKFVLTEQSQGNDGQKAFQIMDTIDGKKGIPYYFPYIRNNKNGHTLNTAIHCLINAANELSDSEKEDVYKSLSDEDKYLLDKWKVPIFLDTLSMGQLILPTVHYRRHF